jgi:formate C-acetyltransferase
MDRKGPSSVLKSASRLDSVLLSNGSLLNLRFHPASFLQPGSFDKFLKLAKTFIQLKLLHVQFSVVSRDDLSDAQQHPERHRDLLVRVAGYSAFFHDLSTEVQADIIGRYEHHLE